MHAQQVSQARIIELEGMVEQLREQLIEAESRLSAQPSAPAINLIRLDEAHQLIGCAREDFDPEVLQAHDWEPALTDLVEPNPYISIMRSRVAQPGRIELLILCPTVCPAPIHLDLKDCAVVSKL
ncbi:TPA: hypothetical protein L4936_001195 [Pseudomonas aeruginosa]|nr:hypothetical protein [Pseudomonas aeruginosa]